MRSGRVSIVRHDYVPWTVHDERPSFSFEVVIHFTGTTTARFQEQVVHLEIFQTNKMESSTNVTWHESTVNQSDRWKLAGHRGAVIWFTGLSGAGKSSIANAVESFLNRECDVRTYLLDGDNIRCVGYPFCVCFLQYYSYME